jgi:site-specific recombinase XerD
VPGPPSSSTWRAEWVPGTSCPLHCADQATNVTRHTLRHSAASFLLAAGSHTKVVRALLGHSSYAITADIYSHVGPAQQREAADRLDQALRW